MNIFVFIPFFIKKDYSCSHNFFSLFYLLFINLFLLGHCQRDYLRQFQCSRLSVLQGLFGELLFV